MTMDQLLVAASIRATIVLAIACGLWPLFVSCRASAAAQHKLWAFALTASLAVPILAGMLPAWKISMPGQLGAFLPQAATREEAQVDATSMFFASVEPIANTPTQSLAHDGSCVSSDPTNPLS